MCQPRQKHYLKNIMILYRERDKDVNIEKLLIVLGSYQVFFRKSLMYIWVEIRNK